MISFDRLTILGNSGSGKSTLARALGAQENAPVIHLDVLYYGANWQDGDAARFRGAVDAATAAPRWIVDGNFVDLVGDLTLARSDTIVLLDIATWRCVVRALGRSLRPQRQRADLPVGCQDRLDPAMFADILRYRRQGEPRLHAAIAAHAARASVLQWGDRELHAALSGAQAGAGLPR